MKQLEFLWPGRRSWSSTRHIRMAIEIAALIVAAVFLGFLMQRLHHANLSLLFLLVALIIAARHGLWPSIATSTLGFLAFNFFFTAPYRTFRVTEEGDIATLVFFLAIAILGGNLASRLRAALGRRDQALERISNLYDFSHRISGAATATEILRTLNAHLAATLGCEMLVAELGPDGTATLLAPVDAPGMAALEQLETVRPALADTRTLLQHSGWLITDIGLPGYGRSRLALHRTDLTAEQQDLVRNLCGQVEVALDRIRLTDDLESSRRETERARLRSALLTSVSHDLRTPLSSIVGATSTVQQLGDDLDSRDRQELLQTVMDEARRLNAYIQNLLDMTRIEHGELQIHREWEEPSDLVDAAIRRARDSWPQARFSVRMARGIGLVHLHGELFVQALHNVIDNAARYSPADSPVEIACERVDDALHFTVTDAGPGLATGERTRIFDMFYRAESRDSRAGGTGLGLAITLGILRAHGGTATAEAAPAGRGTRIVLSVPAAAAGVVDAGNGQ